MNRANSIREGTRVRGVVWCGVVVAAHLRALQCYCAPCAHCVPVTPRTWRRKRTWSWALHTGKRGIWAVSL